MTVLLLIGPSALLGLPHHGASEVDHVEVNHEAAFPEPETAEALPSPASPSEGSEGGGGSNDLDLEAAGTLWSYNAHPYWSPYYGFYRPWSPFS